MLFKQAQGASQSLGEWELESHALNGLGITLLAEGMYEQAHEVFESSNRVFESTTNRVIESPSNPIIESSGTQLLEDSNTRLLQIEVCLSFARSLLSNGYVSSALDWCIRCRDQCEHVGALLHETDETSLLFKYAVAQTRMCVDSTIQMLVEMLREIERGR